MPRTAKKTASTKAAVVMTPEMLAKEIERNQIKLLKTYDSTVVRLKKSVERAKSQLMKAKDKKKAAKDRRVAVTKKVKIKRTVAGQTQLDKAIASYEMAHEAVVELTAQVEQMKAELKSAQNKLAYMSAKDKALIKFDKEWNKSMAQKKVLKKRAKVAVKTTKAKAKAAESDDMITNVMDVVAGDVENMDQISH